MFLLHLAVYYVATYAYVFWDHHFITSSLVFDLWEVWR
jgi:hypothetical protein